MCEELILLISYFCIVKINIDVLMENKKVFINIWSVRIKVYRNRIIGCYWLLEWLNWLFIKLEIYEIWVLILKLCGFVLLLFFNCVIFFFLMVYI